MKIQYYFTDKDGGLDDENFPEDIFDQINQIESDSGINILRGKNISCVAIDESTSNIAGILYSELNNYKFSFDIIVARAYRHKGIGKELIRIGLAEYKQYKYDMDDLKLILDVVNPNLIKYLKKIGLKIIHQEADHTIMTLK